VRRLRVGLGCFCLNSSPSFGAPKGCGETARGTCLEPLLVLKRNLHTVRSNTSNSNEKQLHFCYSFKKGERVSNAQPVKCRSYTKSAIARSAGRSYIITHGCRCTHGNFKMLEEKSITANFLLVYTPSAVVCTPLIHL
jgi:hypothetical protein